MNHWRLALVLVATLAGAASSLAAQETRPFEADRTPADDAELQEAIRGYFEKRLRVELDLTDEQMERLAPRVEQIERERAAIRRERRQIVTGLRRGLRRGADDVALRDLLRRLDALEQRRFESQRAALEGLDQHLTVRQQVQFRFFVERFQNEIRRRVQQLRENRPAAGRQRERSPRRNP